MPELPEIEILKDEIGAQIIGRRVEEIEVFEKKPTVAHLKAALEGKRVTGVRRRGKMLVLDFDGQSLVIHLMMVGQLLLSPPFEGEPHDVCLAINFADGGRLTLGQVPIKCVHLLPSDEAEARPPIAKLGIDPLSEDFTVGSLRRLLRGRRGAIKSLLLNQSVIAGIGNTYADEILFAAKLDPRRRAGSLDEAEVVQLHTSIVGILRRGIELGGSSEMAFVHLDGRRGRFQEHFRVKGRKGKPCTVCGTPIERTVVSGRGTYLCPRCQR